MTSTIVRVDYIGLQFFQQASPARDARRGAERTSKAEPAADREWLLQGAGIDDLLEMAEILRNPAIGNFDDNDDTIEVLGERIKEAAERNMAASQPITGKCEADGRSSPGSHIAKLAPHRLRIGRLGRGSVTKHGVTGPIGIERAHHLKAGQSALAAGNSNSLRYTLHLICRG
jgi:hypothetical protein|tara:strand:- start:13076 stop:13594 length:519 start_codon:yes stop_codon:yes gene_type:complete